MAGERTQNGTAADAAEPGPAGGERLVRLRRDALERSGFPAAQAEAIARRLDIDYLQAIGVLRQGFPPEVAADLLLAGHRSVF